MPPALAFALAAIAAFDPPAQLPDTTQTLALLPVEGQEPARRAEVERRAEVDGWLRAEAKALPGVVLQPLEDTEALLGEVGCQLGALSCRVIVGKRLGVKTLLVARLGPDGALEIDATDVVSQLPRGKASVSLPAPVEAASDGATDAATDAAAAARTSARRHLRDALAELLIPTRAFGSLRIERAPEGALLYVDGLEKGAFPLEGPIERLSLGRHLVEAKLPDGSRLSRFVELHFGEETAVDLLAPVGGADALPGGAAPATGESDLIWYGAGASLAAVGAGALIAAGVLWGVGSAALADLPSSASPKEVQARLDAWGATQVGVVGLCVAGGLALVGGGAAAAVPLFAE